MKNIFSPDRPIRRLPFYVYNGIVLLLVLAGLITSIYLAVSHYRVYTDMGFKSFCAVSRAVNCDTVSQSPYAVFLGLPVAVWGVIGYLFALAMLLSARTRAAARERGWALLFWLFLIFSCLSIALALISSYLIKSYCLMCILTYVINFALMWYAWLTRSRFSSVGLAADTKGDILLFRSLYPKNLLYVSPVLILMIALYSFLPAYWNLQPPAVAAHVASGLTEDGHPWIGAENSRLVITEFTDYQCFQCKKMHFFLRQLISNHPGKIKLIHRNYPMDDKFNPIVKQPLHTGSGEMALLAIYAATQNRFWAMNDLLFEIAGARKDVGIRELAHRTGLDFSHLKAAVRNPGIRRRLLEDIRSGLETGVVGTPTFVIDGRAFVGQIPADVLKKALD